MNILFCSKYNTPSGDLSGVRKNKGAKKNIMTMTSEINIWIYGYGLYQNSEVLFGVLLDK